MKAAGLKAIDTVVNSTAVLIKSKHPSNPTLVDLITARIKGVIGTVSFYSASKSPLMPVSYSRSEICPLHIQHPPPSPRKSHKNHTWETGTYDPSTRRSGVGVCQFHGAEREDSERYG